MVFGNHDINPSFASIGHTLVHRGGKWEINVAVPMSPPHFCAFLSKTCPTSGHEPFLTCLQSYVNNTLGVSPVRDIVWGML